MNISIYNPNKNLNSKPRLVVGFNGNLNKTLVTLRPGKEELSKISSIANHYRQFNLLFKASGKYMTDFLQKSLGFLIPLAGAGFLLKNTLNSDDVQNVKLGSGDKSDELINFTLGGQDDKLKISVSELGRVKFLADDELSETDLDKYSAEINKNHDKLFETLLDKTETTVNAIDEILRKKSEKEIDLNSPEKLSDAVKLFVEERKRIAALTAIIRRKKFIPYFEAKTGMKFINESVLKDKNITFSFINMGNEYFNGVNLTINDNDKGTVQKIIVSDDGCIYKTPLYKIDSQIPGHILTKNLTLLTQNEINSPDLKYMLNYAFTHTDSLFKYILKDFYKGKHIKTVKLDKVIEDEKKAPSKISDKPFIEEYSKVVLKFDIEPTLMEQMEKIAQYHSKISGLHNKSFGIMENLESIEKNSGLIRKKHSNHIVLKDIILGDDMHIGLSKHAWTYKNNELLNFNILNKDNIEIARFKVMGDGKGKLLVKLNSDVKFIDDLTKILNNELNNGLAEKTLLKMKEACYYHEHRSKVKAYMESFNVDASQAIKNLMAYDEANGISKTEALNRKVGRPKNDLPFLQSKVKTAKSAEETQTKQKTSAEIWPADNVVSDKIETEKTDLSERYLNMLKPNGEFKGLKEISLEDVVTQFERIFTLPYTERSSHYIHDIKPDGNVFANRFSVEAPDGAWITVSKVKSISYLNFTYYSIRVQKGDEIMYLNINPLTYRVLRCDNHNNIMRDSDGDKLAISKEKFMAKNPLSQNMSMYFREIFDERSDGARKTIKFQVFSDKKSNAKIKMQAQKDFADAITSSAPESVQKEISLNMEKDEE